MSFKYSTRDLSRKDLNKLLIASQSGDKESYQRFLSWGLETAEKILRFKVFRSSDVDDIVQDVLLGVHRNLQTFDPGRDAKSWFLGILHKKLVDYIRKMSRLTEKEISSEALDVTFSGPQTNDQLEAIEILEGLPENLAQPVILTKIYGHSTKEASDILGINENALRTRLSRSFKMIKENLHESKLLAKAENEDEVI